MARVRVRAVYAESESAARPQALNQASAAPGVLIYNPSMKESSVAAAKLTGFAAACLEKLGLAGADARLVAETLVDSNLRGVDSHGVVRLPHYAKRLRNGTVNARPRISVQRTGTSTAVVEGDRGMGQLVATRAMREAIETASLKPGQIASLIIPHDCQMDRASGPAPIVSSPPAVSSR